MKKFAKILSILCALALIASCISVGFVASAAEATMSYTDYDTFNAQTSYDAYGTNHLASATVSAKATEIIDGVAKPAGSWTPGTGLTDNSPAAQQMIQVTWPSGAIADAAAAAKDYTSTNKYLDYTFSLASAINNPEMVLLAFVQTGTNVSWHNTFFDCRHWAIYASDSAETLYSGEPIYYRQQSGQTAPEYKVDISSLELKNVKYLGVRVYNFYFWGNTVLFSEIGLYGGKSMVTTSALTSDANGSYESEYGANRLAKSTLSYSIVEDSDTTWNKAHTPDLSVLTSNSSSDHNQIQPNKQIGTDGNITQKDEYIELVFNLNSFLSDPEELMLTYRNAGEGSQHFEMFASAEESALFNSSVYEYSASSVAGWQELHVDLTSLEIKNVKYIGFRFYELVNASYLLLRELALYGGTEYSIVSSSSALTDDANNNYNYGDNRLAGSEVSSKGMYEGGEVTVNGSNVVNGATLTDNSTAVGNLIWYNNSWNDSYSDNVNTYIELTFELPRILNNPEKFLFAKDQASYENNTQQRCYNNWYAIYASDSVDTLYDKPFYEYYDYSANSVEDIIDISKFNLTGIKYFGIRIYDLPHNCLIRPAEIALYGGENEAAATVKINNSSTAVNNKYAVNHMTGLAGTFKRIYNNGVLATATTPAGFTDLGDTRGMTPGVDNENTTVGDKTAYHELTYALNFAVDNPDHLLISFAPTEAKGAQYSSQHYAVYMSSDAASLYTDGLVYEYMTKGGEGVGVEHEIDVTELKLQDIKYIGIRFYHRNYGGKYQFVSELGLFGGTTEEVFSYRDDHMYSFVTAYGNNNLHWGGAEAVASDGTSTALTTSAPGVNLTDGNPATLTMITGSNTILTANNNDINQTSAYLQFSFDLLGTLNNPKHAAIAFHEGTSNGVSSQHYAIFAASSKSALYDEASKVYEYKSDAKQGVEHHIDLTKLGKDLTGIKFVGLRIYNRGYNNNVQHLSDFGVYGGSFTAEAKLNMTVNADFTDDSNNSYESIYGKNMLANGSMTYSHSSDLAYSSLPPKFDYLTNGLTDAWNQIQPTTGRIGHQGIYGQYISYLDIEFNLNSAISNPEKFLISFGRADSLQPASQHYAVYFLADGETVETTSKVYEYKSKERENYEHIIPLSNMSDIKKVVVRFYESASDFLLPSEIALYGGTFEMTINYSATMVDGSYEAVYGENVLKNASLNITATGKGEDLTANNGNNNSLPLTDGLGYDGSGNSRTYIENKTLKETVDENKVKIYANDYTQTDNYIDLTFALNGVLNNPESFMMAWPSDSTQAKPSLHYVLYASDKLETLYQNPIRTYQNASRQGVEHIFDLSALNLTNIKYFGVRFYERMAWDILLISEIAVYGGEYEAGLELAGSVIMGSEKELDNYDIQYRVNAEYLTYKSITDMGMIAGFKFELQGRNNLDTINKAKATELLKMNADGSTKFYNSKLVGAEALYFQILNSGSKTQLDDRSGYAIYAIGYITFTDAEGREISLWSNTMTKSSKQISRSQARDFYNMGGEYKEIAETSYAGYDFTNANTDISKVRAYVMECANLDPDMVTTTTQVVTDGVLSESFLEKGRTYVLDSALGIDNAASGVEFNAYCRGDITIKVNGNGENSADNRGHKLVCVIDGVASYDLTVPAGSYEYDLTVATGVKQGNHTIGIYRMTPGKLDLISVTFKGKMLEAPERKAQTIAFIGDSITVGHYSVISLTTADGETITDWDGSKIKNMRADIIDEVLGQTYLTDVDWGLIQFSGSNILVGNSVKNDSYPMSEYSYQIKFTDENGNTRYLAKNTTPSAYYSNSYDDYSVKTAIALGAEWDNMAISGDTLESVVNSNKIFTQTYRDTSVAYNPNADIYVINMATNSIYSGSNASNYGAAMQNAVTRIRQVNTSARIVFVYGSMRNDELGVYLDQTWTKDANYDIAEHHENIRNKAAALKEAYGDIYVYGFEHIKRQGGGGNHPSMAQQDEMAKELASYLSTAFTDVYVDKVNGSDSNIGSESKPVKTLAKAAQLAGDEDKIKVVGTYTVESTERIGISGKAITIEGANSDANLSVTTMVFGGDTTIDNIKVNFAGSITHGTETASALVYAQYNDVTFGSGITTTSTANTVGAYAYGGMYDNGSWSDTHLTINGGTWYRVFGNSDKHNGVANNTYVTVGGNAVVTEVLGGGHFITDSGVTYNSVGVSANVTINGGTISRVFGGGRGSVTYAHSTNVVINGGTYYEDGYETGMSVFGGTTNAGSVTNTKVTLNDGVVNQIFGGNEGSSVNYGPPCSTEIYLLGGKITYRVYGGCYNYVSTGILSITFESNNYVNGSTYVYVSDEVNMAFDDQTAESYMGYDDKSLSATSRVDLRKSTSAFVTDENATLEFESQAKYDEIKNGEHMGNSYTEGYNPYDILIIAGVTQ